MNPSHSGSFLHRRAFIFLLAAGLSHILPAAAPSSAGAEKIQPWLARRGAPGRVETFFVILKEQADLTPTGALQNKAAKGRFVHAALARTADRTQAPLQAWLRARGIPFQSYYIVNAILVTGDLTLMETLAARPDVVRLEGNPSIHNPLPAPEFTGAEGGGIPDVPEHPDSPAAIEWNVVKTRGPEVWALGFRGEGIVVGMQDTGYRWTHTFIQSKYRGWNGVSADHNYHWHDAIHANNPNTGAGNICGFDSPAPCDDYGHGTHTAGTVLGDDGGANQTGMAPNAKWIGCRNMEQGWGTPATYLECMQFFLAPTRLDGSGADPALAPDLTTNSWTCPPAEGCSWDTLQAGVDAQKAAGIMTVIAAGNFGPACNSVLYAPAMYASAYTVGSTTSADALSAFSSRGPGTGNGLMKPDIVAPGSGVRSAWSGSDTATNTVDGTSMATPNVAGCVALLWSARACYRKRPDETAALLNASAVRLPALVEGCGGDYVAGPNNSWGHGRLDCLAAVNGARTAPETPAAPGATSACAGVALTWPAAELATTYTVLRGVSCAALAPLAGGVMATNYTDPSGAPDTTYFYAVRADATCGSSAVSACVSGQRPGAPPMSVLNQGKSGTDLVQNWTSVAGAINYRVYRAAIPNPGSWGAPVATVSSPGWSDLGQLALLPANAFYIVTTVDSCGQESTQLRN